MEMSTAMLVAKVADAARDRRVWTAAGCVILGVLLLLAVPITMAGGILSTVYALINPILLGNLEDDLHYQAIQEVRAEYEIENDLNVYTLKVIDLLHHHDLMRDRGEIRQYLIDYFILEEEVEIEKEEDEEESESSDESEDEDEEETETETIIIYRFLLPDEIMEMIAGPPFNFGVEEMEAIREMIFNPPTTEELNFTGKLPMPCSGYISSPFGYRVDPLTGKNSYHSGIDIVPMHRAPLKAVADGTVVRINLAGAIYGNTITIRHTVDGKTIYTYYAHCSSIAAKVGDTVKQGDVVAYEGGGSKDPNPGRSTGHHLHFEIRLNIYGGQVDPLKYLAGY